MKLMTYNVFEGAQDTFPQVLETIDIAKPDTLVLNEASGFNRDGKIEALASLGLMYYHIEPCGDGDIYDVALLSREPFAEDIQTIHPLARAAILAVVKFPELGDVAIAGAHLTPFSEAARKKEERRIIAKLKSYPNAALTGDLNSLSPQDAYKVDLLASLTPSQRRKFSSKGELSYSTIQDILDAGFVDVAVQMGLHNIPTVPTQANRDPDHARLRLDYVFVTGQLAARASGYRVIVNEATEAASDHYPIIVDFEG